jgi:hypothetical protein
MGLRQALTEPTGKIPVLLAGYPRGIMALTKGRLF